MTLAAVEPGQRDVYVDAVYVEPDVRVVDDAKSIHKTGRDRSDGEPNRQSLTTCLNSTDPAMQRLVLTARTGFGKSTAVNMRVQWATKAGTPLLMLRLPSLRASASPQSKTKPSERVEAALIQDIHAKNVVKAGDETQLARWLIEQFDTQPGIIMFDALDEVPLPDRDDVVTCVRSFLDGLARTKLPHRVLITSRPYAYTEQFAPDNFKRIELAEFTPDQQDELIHIHCVICASAGQDAYLTLQIILIRVRSRFSTTLFTLVVVS